jgi:hypothetical protein
MSELLFSWISNDGLRENGDIIPTNDESIVELILNRREARFEEDGVRKHESHPMHEKAVREELPPRLRVLRAVGCRLRTFPNMPSTIHEIYLKSNNIIHLPELSQFNDLISIDLEDNCISSVYNPLPPNLAYLNLNINAIRHYNKVLFHDRNINVTMESNPVNFGIAARMFNRDNGLHGQHDRVGNSNVYKNSQNVHDSGVQSSVHKNIDYLTNFEPDTPENPNMFQEINLEHQLFLKSSLSFFQRIKNALFSSVGMTRLAGNILRNYCMNEYSMHGVTIKRLTDRIWLRIKRTNSVERREELTKRLIEEVTDGNANCTNGMMTRLANVFVGFDDNVEIKLNPTQVLGARITTAMERLRKEMNLTEGRETVTFWEKVYRTTVDNLTELDVNKSDWQTWLDPIADNIIDTSDPKKNARFIYNSDEWKSEFYKNDM